MSTFEIFSDVHFEPDTSFHFQHHGKSRDTKVTSHEACAFLSLSTMVKSAPTVEKGLTQNNPAQPEKWYGINAREKVITAQFVAAKQLLPFLRIHHRTMAS